MISSEGGIYVTDFGLSIFENQKHIKKVYNYGQGAGTIGYMSPEMIGYFKNNNTKLQISYSSDVFSFGLFSFRLISMYDKIINDSKQIPNLPVVNKTYKKDVEAITEYLTELMNVINIENKNKIQDILVTQ